MRSPSAGLVRLAAFLLVLGAGVLAIDPVAPATRAKPARPAAAGALPWPIDRTPAIVSTFGEYRYDHLHAGIDISTGGSIGVPVHAVADGAIYRLKIEWRGYGRALYLKHDRGDVSVYGHLDAYEEKTLGLETRVRNRRRETGSPYPGDLFLDPPVRVTRGQVIAYTGESGVGPPHLHFEMRGPQDNPIDPFRSGIAAPPDRSAPVLDSILLTAATPATVIDGGWRARSVELARRGAGFEPSAPTLVDGPVLATLVAWDPVGDGRAGLASVRMALDGADCFKVEVAAFRFDQYPIAGLLFDHRASRMGPMRMGFRLAPLPGNVFAEGRCGGAGGPPGSLDLPPGEHRLEIVARDASGLESRARIPLRRVAPGSSPPAATPAGAAGGSLDGAALRFFPGFFEATLPTGRVPPSIDRCGAPVAGLAWRALEGERLVALPIDYETGAALSATIAAGGIDPACPLVTLLGGTRIFRPGVSEALRQEAGAATVDLPAGARFFPGPVVLRSGATSDLPAGLRPVAEAIDLLPSGEALDARGTLAFRVDPALGDPRRLGIYRYDETARRWGFEGDDAEPGGGTVSIPFRRYGRFALLADESAPEILEVRPRGGVVGRRPALSVRVAEVGKGLGWDGVRLVLDDRPIASEFDPDRMTARPFEPPTLAVGRHRLTVTVTDRAGNAAEPVTVEFEVR